MKRSRRYPDHTVTFPLEDLPDDDGDDATTNGVADSISTSADSSDEQNGILKRDKRPRKEAHRRKVSSYSQPEHQISPSQSYASDTSALGISESSQRPKTASEASERAPITAQNPPQSPAPRQAAIVTRSSSAAPERVPNQPRSPRLEPEAQDESEQDKGDPSKKLPGSSAQRSRGYSRLQSLKDGLRDLFTER
jgi:hypothetical protein